MRFVSFYSKGSEDIGVLVREGVVPINDLFGSGFKSMVDFIEHVNTGQIIKAETALVNNKYNYLPWEEIKLLAPIPYPPRNVFCLGKNYAEHAREIKMTQVTDTGIPECPIYFTKLASPAITHGDQIQFSRKVTSQVDYEVELAVVIGKTGKDINIEEAEDYIFGYTIVNDVTARDLQGKHKQWFKGKSLDTFCPMGPAIVHKNEIPFPVELDIQCRINGELRQNSNTRHMLFDIPYIISDISRGLTLKPGDIICTGTPSGVGMGFDPPQLLKNGDIVECCIEKIGKMANKVVEI